MADLDPTTIGIIWQRLIYVAEEQAKTLVRASFTSQSGEMQDISSAIFDTRGNMIAEGITGTVGIITALMQGLKHFVREYPPESLAPGDVLVSNDPWILSGHTFDIAVVRPVFLRESCVGYTATVTHLTDIGGKGWATVTADIYEEGLRIPIMKLFRSCPTRPGLRLSLQGERNEDLFRILKLNVRTPDQVEGDLMAQVAATEVGAQRLAELLEEYDLEDLEEVGQEICARTEAATREAVRTVPPGVYKGESFLDGFEAPLRIAATVTAEGDRLVVDYAGTSPQIPRGINAAYNYTLAHTVFNIKASLCPDIPNNEGGYRDALILKTVWARV
ncbi:MAG TPA: hydantoinase B/oxoprolinase family protein [Dehalococcoidia bacterium]|nr:hydantoinase B/oxoprolinase family protein [Dehalococcoidia bacterium]